MNIFFIGLVLGYLSPGIVIAEQNNKAIVAVLPFTVHADKDLSYLADGMRDMLASRLASGGGVKMIEKAKVNEALKGHSNPQEEKDFNAIGAFLGADQVIAGSLTALGGGVSLDAKVFSSAAGTTKNFFSTAPRESDVIIAVQDLAWDIGEKTFGQKRPAPKTPVQPQTSSTEAGPIISPHPDRAFKSGPYSALAPDVLQYASAAGAQGFTKSQDLELDLQGMDVGDLDGDGADEVVLADRTAVRIYRRDTNRLNMFWQIPTLARYKIHGVSIADVDGNGRQELYVSAADAKEPRSFAAEWNGKGFDYLFKDVPWYIRALKMPGEGNVLAGQQAAVDNPVFSGIYRLLPTNGALQKGEMISVPNDINLFDFSLADLDNDGRVETITIDQSDRLSVFRHDGKLLWKSDDYFGGTKRFIGGEKEGFGTQGQKLNVEERIYIPGRIIIADVNNDGQQDVVLNKNLSTASRVLKNLKSYPSGEIHALTWNGIALTELWQTRKIDGYIADYVLRVKEDKNSALLVVGLILRGGLTDIVSTPESTVLMYELKFQKQEGQKP